MNIFDKKKEGTANPQGATSVLEALHRIKEGVERFEHSHPHLTGDDRGRLKLFVKDVIETAIQDCGGGQ